MNNMNRRTLTLLICCSVFGYGHAQEDDGPKGDGTYHFETIEQIIETESQFTSQRDREIHYNEVWNKTRYLSLSYNVTTLSSTSFPTLNGKYEGKYKNSFGFSLLLGKTFLLHKKPIGSFLFAGIDFTGIDFTYNCFETTEAAPSYEMGTQIPYNLPWHHGKWTLDYGMSVGPSVTMYPFTALGKSVTDKIRIQAYFHLGYHLGLLSVEDVISPLEDEVRVEHTWANGLSTTFGFNLTWDFIGLGYEVRKISHYAIRPISQSFQSGRFVGNQMLNRFYIQYKF